MTVYFDRKQQPASTLSEPSEGASDDKRTEQRQAFDRAYTSVTKAIMTILTLANSSEHVPLTDYDFEITVNPLASSGIYPSDSGSLKSSSSQPSSRAVSSPSQPIPINPNNNPNNSTSSALRLFPHANI